MCQEINPEFRPAQATWSRCPVPKQKSDLSAATNAWAACSRAIIDKQCKFAGSLNTPISTGIFYQFGFANSFLPPAAHATPVINEPPFLPSWQQNTATPCDKMRRFAKVLKMCKVAAKKGLLKLLAGVYGSPHNSKVRAEDLQKIVTANTMSARSRNFH